MGKKMTIAKRRLSRGINGRSDIERPDERWSLIESFPTLSCARSNMLRIARFRMHVQDNGALMWRSYCAPHKAPTPILSAHKNCFPIDWVAAGNLTLLPSSLSPPPPAPPPRLPPPPPPLPLSPPLHYGDRRQQLVFTVCYIIIRNV